MRYLLIALFLWAVPFCANTYAKDLLVFGAEWCPRCVQLKTAIEQDPTILDGFELSLIDIEQEPQIAKAYGVQAIPVLIVLEPGGKLRKKIGFRNTADLKAWLQTTN